MAAVLAVLVIATGACGDGSAEEEGVKVVATTTILGDVAANIVGDAGTVEVLVPVGADPHEFQASSRQVAGLVDADLIVANGLGLEEGLEDVLDAAQRDGATVLEIGPDLDPQPFADASGEGALDPHVWMDPLRMVEATTLIAEALATIEPETDWESPASAYRDALLAAHEEIEAILLAVPAQNRKLVTNHDALGYFAARYGFEVVGVVIPGGSTLANPSSAELASLVGEIESAGVQAIFAETIEPTSLADAVADEVGYEVAVVPLYTGSLGEPGSGADTLVGMHISNAHDIAGALS